MLVFLLSICLKEYLSITYKLQINEPPYHLNTNQVESYLIYLLYLFLLLFVTKKECILFYQVLLHSEEEFDLDSLAR